MRLLLCNRSVNLRLNYILNIIFIIVVWNTNFNNSTSLKLFEIRSWRNQTLKSKHNIFPDSMDIFIWALIIIIIGLHLQHSLPKVVYYLKCKFRSFLSMVQLWTKFIPLENSLNVCFIILNGSLLLWFIFNNSKFLVVLCGTLMSIAFSNDGAFILLIKIWKMQHMCAVSLLLFKVFISNNI